MDEDFPAPPEDMTLPERSVTPRPEQEVGSSLLGDEQGTVVPAEEPEVDMLFDTDDFAEKVNGSVQLQGQISGVVSQVVNDESLPKADLGTVLQLYKEVTAGTVKMIGAATKLVDTVVKNKTYMLNLKKNGGAVPRNTNPKKLSAPKKSLVPSTPEAVPPAPAAEPAPAGASIEQVHEGSNDLSHSMFEGVREAGAAIEPEPAPGLGDEMPAAPVEAPAVGGHEIDPTGT